MKALRLLAIVWTICSTLALVLLIWNEDKTTCGITTCKVFETVFLIVALMGCNIIFDINKSIKEKN